MENRSTTGQLSRVFLMRPMVAASWTSLMQVIHAHLLASEAPAGKMRGSLAEDLLPACPESVSCRSRRLSPCPI